MTELDEWRKKMRSNATTDPDEILAAMQRNVDPNAPLYRLELLYDEATKTVILQGNQAGLESLLRTIERLARPDEGSGAHAHFDSATDLSKNDVDMIIQRVGDDDIGAHAKGE